MISCIHNRMLDNCSLFHYILPSFRRTSLDRETFFYPSADVATRL